MAKRSRKHTPPAAEIRPPSDIWMLVLGVAALVVITFIAYSPTLDNGFVWDDYTYVIRSPMMASPDALHRFWFTTEGQDYFPLVYTLFWLQFKNWGPAPAGYHIVNILLHAVVSVLGWFVLKRLKVPGAFLAALVFAVHPVNVESVSWMFQQRTTLPVVFTLLTILMYLRYEEDTRARWYVLSLALFVLGLLSKTSVVMLPFVLLMCAWWQRRRIAVKDLLRSIPFFVLSAALGLVTVFVQYNRTIAHDEVHPESPLARLAGAGWAVWFYLYKALLPLKLIFVYPRWSIDPQSVISYLPLAALAACFVVLWLKRGTWGRPLLMAFGYFVITLVPVLGFLSIYFMRYSLVADHWQYQSILGIIALVVGLAAHAARAWDTERRNMAIGAACVVVLVLFGLTWKQQSIYRDEETLWRDTIAGNPSAWMAYNNLGLLIVGQGDVDSAIAIWKRALRVFPRNTEAMICLAGAYNEKQEYDKSLPLIHKALEIKPDSPHAHNNLAAIYAARGEVDKAIAEYEEALRINPGFAKAHSNLGIFLSQQGKMGEAIDHFTKAVQLDPESPNARNNLGVAYMRTGMTEQAIEQFRKAVELKPDYMEARRNLESATSGM